MSGFHNIITALYHRAIQASFSSLHKGLFVRIYDENLLGCKSHAISVRISFLIAINLLTISWNQLESHDLMIPLRSDGNQASGLYP